MKPHHRLYVHTYCMLLICIVLIISCAKITPKEPEPNQVMNAPLDGLNFAQKKLFFEGAEEFDEFYSSQTGLGPIFVTSSCAGCHAGDNRGHASTFLIRFGQSDTLGNTFMDYGAPQIQHNAIPGYTGESLPSGATYSKFLAPIAAGVGFLELVSDDDILAMADENDADGDGISGRPNWNYIPSFITPPANAKVRGGKYICRFGRKGSTFNLVQQTAGAFNQDMGITTTLLPNDPVNYADGLNSPYLHEPDLDDNKLNAVIFYLRVLQAPLRRDENNEEVVKGEQLFISAGCEKCHKQTLKTSYSPIEPLSFKEFHPYTDLLLHDMGDGLDDNYTEGTAATYEWRTPPLWGLGLAASAQGGLIYLMHDGRATSIENAILLHGGEALNSRNNYSNLNSTDKQALLKFLESL